MAGSTGFLLGGCKLNRSPHLPARILGSYIGALTGFGHIYFLEGLNHTSPSKGYALGAILETEKASGTHSKNRGESKKPTFA